MTAKRKDRADFNTRVHAIFEKIGAGDPPPDVEAKQAEEQARRDTEAKIEKEAAKDPAAVALGRKGGKKGGPARQAQLTEAERRELGKEGAAARWGRKNS